MMASSIRRPKPSSACSPHFRIHQTSAAEPETRKHGEGAVGRALAKDAKIPHLQGRPDEDGETAPQQLLDGRALGRVVEASRQGEMEAPFLQDIGIAPAREELLLARRKAVGAPSRQFGLV